MFKPGFFMFCSRWSIIMIIYWLSTWHLVCGLFSKPDYIGTCSDSQIWLRPQIIKSSVNKVELLALHNVIKGILTDFIQRALSKFSKFEFLASICRSPLSSTFPRRNQAEIIYEMRTILGIKSRTCSLSQKKLPKKVIFCHFLNQKKTSIFSKIWYQKWILWLISIPKMCTFTNITVKVCKLQHSICF